MRKNYLIILELIFYWLPPVLWGLVIFSFSSHSVPTSSAIVWQDFIIKKTAHMIEYAIFAVLIFRGLRQYGVTIKAAGWIAIIFALLYGATDEYHQSFVAGREPRLRDVGFDTIGAAIGIYTVWNLLPKAPKRLRNLAKDLHLI